jgi:membrane protein
MDTVWTLIKQTGKRWTTTATTEHSAALAFYAAVSLTPLLVFTLAILSRLFPGQNVEQQVIAELSGLLGQQLTQAITSLVEAEEGFNTTGWLSIVVGVASLLWGSSRVFRQIQRSLNDAWNVERDKDTNAVVDYARKRLLTMTLVFITGLVVFVITSADTVIFRLWPAVAPDFQGGLTFEVIRFAGSIVLLTGLFAAMYKILPDAEIEWRDVLVGAFVTAVLFTLGQILISAVLQARAVTRAVGAAGTLLLLLFWMYYSSRVFLWGAMFTSVYADRRDRMGARPEVL